MRLLLAWVIPAVFAVLFVGCDEPDEESVCPKIARSSQLFVRLVGYADDLGDDVASVSVFSEDVPVSADASIAAWDEGAECRFNASLGTTQVRCFPQTSGVLDVSIRLEGPFDELVGEHELSIELTQGGSTRSGKAIVVLEEEYPYGEDCGPYNVTGTVDVDVASLQPSAG